MSNDTSQRQTTFADIRDYELQGAAVMAQPTGAQRWGAIMELCQRIKDTEPQAFEVAADWIEGELEDTPIVTYAEPFGEWWRRHYNCNPVMMARWRALVDLMGKTEVEVSIYAPMAIGIYVVLRLNVPKEYAEPRKTTFVDEQLQTPEAGKFLKALEGETIQIHGKGWVKLIDTSTTPWSYASMGTLKQIVEYAQICLGLTYPWKVFEDAFGVKNLQQAKGKECIEVENALEKAGFDLR